MVLNLLFWFQIIKSFFHLVSIASFFFCFLLYVYTMSELLLESFFFCFWQFHESLLVPFVVMFFLIFSLFLSPFLLFFLFCDVIYLIILIKKQFFVVFWFVAVLYACKSRDISGFDVFFCVNCRFLFSCRLPVNCRVLIIVVIMSVESESL